MDQTDFIDPDVLKDLARAAGAADASCEWPAHSWERLCAIGGPAWAIPQRYGGQELDGPSLLARYEAVAAACLTTAFILSQRDAAARRIRDSGRDDVCRELLRPLACGGRFATVGISQLTTSRQHGAPALRARQTADGFVLDGVMPWVTGADQAHQLVAGATLADGNQILLAVPTDRPGLRVGPPLDLMALAGSRTAEVVCAGVEVHRRWLVAGPAERVMQTGRGGTGGLETSCLALGLASAAIDMLIDESRRRPEWSEIAGKLDGHRRAAQAEMYAFAADGASAERTTALRARANALVLRATQAALTAAKGVGFVRPHPAQRWARQALFFLVWSCPRPAAEATLDDLLGSCSAD